MIRKILKGWLGIGAIEFQAGRMAQSLSTDKKAIDELTESVAKLRGAVSRNDERIGDFSKNLTGHQQWHGERMQLVEGRLDKLEHEMNADIQTGEVETRVEKPITCPKCGRTGLVRAAVIETIDANEPTTAETVGYGLACPKCKHAFYWQGGRAWASDEKLDDDAADQVGAPASASTRAQTVPKVRWSGPRGRRT